VECSLPEGINDHALLRHDPRLAAACEKIDPLGGDRVLPQFRDDALAAPATLNRLELSNHKHTRCHKLCHDPGQVEACLLKLGTRCLPKDAREVVLDLDATGALLYGQQEGRFFHGYYGDYCYLPLYVFCGNTPLWAQLRTADRPCGYLTTIYMGRKKSRFLKNPPASPRTILSRFRPMKYAG
jgi:hypothetical protein